MKFLKVPYSGRNYPESQVNLLVLLSARYVTLHQGNRPQLSSRPALTSTCSAAPFPCDGSQWTSLANALAKTPAPPCDFTASRPESPDWDQRPVCLLPGAAPRWAVRITSVCRVSPLWVSAATTDTRAGVVTVPQERDSQVLGSLCCSAAAWGQEEPVRLTMKGNWAKLWTSPFLTHGHLKYGSRTKHPVNNSLSRAVKNMQCWVHKLNSKLPGHFPFNFPNLL